MAIETGFPCIPTIEDSEGEGRGRVLERGAYSRKYGSSYSGIW